MQGPLDDACGGSTLLLGEREEESIKVENERLSSGQRARAASWGLGWI